MISRRTFLKLFGMGLAAAGVTATTIVQVFPEEEKRGEQPDKMAVADAIRKIVARQKRAESAAEMRQHANSALRVIAEAHRDFSLIWAGGAVTLYAEIGGCLPSLVREARETRNDPRISPLIVALKKALMQGNEEEGNRLQLDAFLAYCEMEGFSQAESYARFKAGNTYVWDWYQKHKPGEMAKAFGLVETSAAA